MSNNKTLNWVIKYIGSIVLVLSLVAILIFSEIMNSSYNSNFDSKVNYFETGWVFTGTNEDVKFPFTLKDGKRECSITNTFKEITNEDVLILEYQYQEVNMIVDGVSVYKSTYPYTGHVKSILGTNILSIPLKEEYSNKTVVLEMVGVKLTEPVSITHMYLTTTGDYLHKLFRENVFQLVIAGILFITGVLYLFIYVTSKIKKLKLSVPVEYFLSLFLFSWSVGLWIVCDLHLLFLMTGHIVVNDILSYYAFMCIPVGFVAIVQYLIKSYEKIFTVMEIVFCLNIIVQLILFFGGIVDLANMLIVSHILLYIGLFITIILVIISAIKHRTRERMFLIGGFALFMILMLISLFGYTLGSADFNYNLFFLFGMLIMSIIFGYIILKELVLVMGENAHVEQALEYAYKDALTGIGNRRAFEEKIEEDKNLVDKDNYSIIVFDINFLKKANDNFGHNVGDELIITAASFIKEIFANEEENNVYRIGGDEFSAICNITKEELENKIIEFEEKCKAWKGMTDIGLSVARGYAYWNDEADISIEELKVKADNAMYRNKRLKHKK